MKTPKGIAKNNIDATKMFKQLLNPVENLYSNTSDVAKFSLSFADSAGFCCMAREDDFNFLKIDRSEKETCAKFKTFSEVKIFKSEANLKPNNPSKKLWKIVTYIQKQIELEYVIDWTSTQTQAKSQHLQDTIVRQDFFSVVKFIFEPFANTITVTIDETIEAMKSTREKDIVTIMAFDSVSSDLAKPFWGSLERHSRDKEWQRKSAATVSWC